MTAMTALALIKHVTVVSKEDAERLRCICKHHLIIKEGDRALHYVYSPETGYAIIVGCVTFPTKQDHAQTETPSS